MNGQGDHVMSWSRHAERDNQLPAIRKQFLERIKEDLCHDSAILALFIVGSVAEQKDDLYSDIDLRAVVPDERLSDWIEEKRERAKQWGDVLFFEEPSLASPYTVIHYANFLKVDWFLYARSEWRPSVWWQNIHILHDPYGIAKETHRQSLQLRYRVKDSEVEEWRRKVLAYLHETYRRVMRGEWYYALKMVDSLRLYVVAGWDMEAGRPPRYGDWAHAEGERSRFSIWQQQLLAGWYCGRDSAEIMETVRSMLPELHDLHRRLCRMTGLEERREWWQAAIEMVM
jgi:hypothetical protein